MCRFLFESTDTAKSGQMEWSATRSVKEIVKLKKIFQMNAMIHKFLSALIVMLLFVITADVALAQRGNISPEQLKERQYELNEEMMSRLNLSDEQAPKVSEILTTAVDLRIDVMTESRNSGGDRSAMREKMDKMDEKMKEELAEILTEDQMTLFRKLIGERPQRGRRGNRPS